MAFFDEIGKKISNAGQDAIEKTKNATSIAKINSSIADEKKYIYECYRRIGEIFYELKQSSDNSDIQYQVESINHSKEKIENYQKQLNEIKGVTICDKCQAEVPIGSSFCPFCGGKIETKVVDNDVYHCPECNEIIDKNLNFCTNCGAKIAKED